MEERGYIPNGAYIIKRLKACYPSFANHVDRLDKAEKKFLFDQWENATKHFTIRDVSDALNKVCAENTRCPTLQDILEAIRARPSKLSASYHPDPDLESRYARTLHDMAEKVDGSADAWRSAKAACARHYSAWINAQRNQL